MFTEMMIIRQNWLSMENISINVAISQDDFGMLPLNDDSHETEVSGYH